MRVVLEWFPRVHVCPRKFAIAFEGTGFTEEGFIAYWMYKWPSLRVSSVCDYDPPCIPKRVIQEENVGLTGVQDNCVLGPSLHTET